MPKKIGLESHLSSEELEERYRGAKDPILRSHYQIIWLIWQGKTTSQVMEVTGYSRDWIQKLARRYNRMVPTLLATEDIETRVPEREREREGASKRGAPK